MIIVEDSPGLFYDIVQTLFDPNRPWELVVAAPNSKGILCIRFRTYGDAWREAERRKAAEAKVKMLAAEQLTSQQLDVAKAQYHHIPEFPGLKRLV